MADENNPDENDVEAEMMRMMQEELSGDEGEGGGDSDDDAALAEMAAALGGDDAGDGNIDEMLEQEMLKAMQNDSGDDASSSSGGGALPAFGGASTSGAAPDGIERLADVDVNVTVELGDVLIEVKDIMQWTRDSIVELEAQESDPVSILVNGKLFARGEVVVVADTFGVRILELVDPPIEPAFKNK